MFGRTAILGFAFWLGILPFSLAEDKASRDWQVWETQIQPVSESFSGLDEIQLILTVKNIGKEPRLIAIPYLETHDWPQWVQVFKDGKRVQPKVDEDYVYPPGTLRPGEKLSLLVSLDKFYVAPLKGSQKGRYELLWKGTTIGLAQDARSEFVVDPKMKASTDIFSMAPYLEAHKTKEDLWKKILAAPSDPKWLGLFRIIPAESIDAPSLVKLAEVTDDLGIKREAVQALGRIGKNPEAEKLLVEFLKQQDDHPLVELGVLSLKKLRGQSP